MAFLQIIEFRTSNIDALRKLDREWEQATEGKRTARRQIVTQDRNNPDRYLVMVFFDSYEAAMQNSALPETQAIAEKYASILDEPPDFHDLDIIDDSALM